MRSEWIVSSIGSIVDYKKGFAFKSKDYQASGTPVVRVSNFTQDSIDMSDVSFVNHEVAAKNQNVQLLTDDVVIATVGSWPTNPASVVGKTIKVPNFANNSLLNQNAVRLRGKEESIDQKFLYYLFKNKNFSAYLVSNAQGSANQASITLNDIFSYMFSLPPLPIQKKIAHILSTLDDKIELNRKINQTLEAMAQALFKSWFVDFDPVRARAEAKSDAELEMKAAELGIAKEVLDLFPSRLVESEMGMIPEGWSYDILGSICKVQSGYAFKGAWWQDTGVKVVKIKNINGTEVDTNDCQCVSQEIADKNAKFKLNHGDCLIAMTGATVGKVGIVDTSEEEFLLNQRVGRFQPIEPYVEYVKTLTKTDKFFDAIQSEAQGSAQPNISATGIEEIKIVKPSDMVIEAFAQVLKPIFSKMLSHQSEVHTLQRTRDTLLPKLLSGELDVSEVQI